MIRKRVPDKFKAKSLIEASELEMKFIRTLKVSKESGSTIVGRIYENFRRLGEALMLINGKESVGAGHHNDVINELLLLNIETKRPILVLKNLKKIRENINYEGYIPNLNEVEDVLSIADACFKPILKEVLNELEKL
ncbi:MAG: hypothetical protein Q8R00_00180 [Candidatus Nanoarchaeia archaeon]|nr:hypothetical protein [Candidatus Nanoarchaeia archaeon]